MFLASVPNLEFTSRQTALTKPTWEHICTYDLASSAGNGARSAALHNWRYGRRSMLELSSSKVSVDQDLSVIVAETINDDDVKQRLVPIVFTRA